MMDELYLEGKLCPIDDTQLEVRQWPGSKQDYIFCQKCNAIYKNSNNLEEEAKEYLKLLEEWNKAEIKKIIEREEIINLGKLRGII